MENKLNRLGMVKAVLQLLRFQNLLIVIAVQYAIRWLVIYPMITAPGFEFQLDELHFFIVVLSTVLLTAAGYVINDYFDQGTDLVNRPDTVVVGRLIKRRTAMGLHITFNTIGVGLGFYISYYVGIIEMGFIYAIIAGILWYYSTTYKRQLLIGNIIVACLTALVPLLVVLYEIPMLNKAYAALLEPGSNFNSIFFFVVGFSYFVFMTTLIREIIKDIEDLEGDNAYDRNTLPIVFGVRNTKITVIGLIVITILSLCYILYHYLYSIFDIVYVVVLICIPLLLLSYKLIKADSKKQYGLCSTLTKLIMLFGLFYLVFSYVMNVFILV